MIAVCLLICGAACSQTVYKDKIIEDPVPVHKTETKYEEVYSDDLGEFTVPFGSAYGEEPDLDVIIDGNLDDELWKDKKWYTQYEPSQRVFIEVTSAMSEKGFYLAARSDDLLVFWNGYNYFYNNTHFYFQFYSGDNTAIRIDAVSMRVTHKFINARSRVYGQVNSPGNSQGIGVEIFVTWDQLGINVSNGLPEEIKILPIYCYANSYGASGNKQLLPTFVKTMGDSGQVIRFGAEGYTDGDNESARVGSHVKGPGKTNGWTVENAGTENETATSNGNYTFNFAQTVFFREVVSSSFRVSATLKVKSVTSDTRAGILLYKDNINYRTVALSLNKNNFSGNVIKEYDLMGYTNFPSNITIKSELIKVQPKISSDTVELTVYGINGRLYYIVNEAYVFSEEASYVGVNAFLGLYSFNGDIEFSNYSYETFDGDSAEFGRNLAKYAYTITVENPFDGTVAVTPDQLAVSREADNRLKLTMTFQPGYTMDEMYYTDSTGVKYDLMSEARKAVGGEFYIGGIKDNIQIYATAKKLEGDLVDLKLEIRSEQTGELLKNIDTYIIGSGPFSRFDQKFKYFSEATLSVNKNETWKYVAWASGYRSTTGALNGGEPVNASYNDYESMYIVNSILGGTAQAILDKNGDPVTSLTVDSNPGNYWDLSLEEEGKAVFQTSQDDKGIVYFSGRTISDYQVAYVEIINRTDPSSFSSFENDPAAGFIIAGSSQESFMGMRKTGLRLKTERNNWTSGTYTDTLGVMNYAGYLGNTDRDNGGRFITSYAGSGTVDRIPHEGREYANSFLMIRKGPYLYFYAADGSRLVQPDGTNFKQLTQVGSYVNTANTGYAAVGLACTVAYNLRMDFENYWILSGSAAAAFVAKCTNMEIAADITVTGSQYADIEGNGLVDYEPAEGTVSAKAIVGGEITISPITLSDNEILKIQCSDGTVKYVTSKFSSASIVIEKRDTVFGINISKVPCVTVSGSVLMPDGKSAGVCAGTVYDASGRQVSTFKTNSDGTFTAKVEKNARLSIGFTSKGYSMNNKSFTATSNENLGTMSFYVLKYGVDMTLSDGKTISTAAGSEIKNNEEYGDYFEYINSNSGNGQLVFTDDYNHMQNFVLTFSYERKASPVSSAKEDGDASVGLRLYADGVDLEALFIGTGYRVYHEGQFDKRVDKRGISRTDMAQKTTAAPYDFKMIKLDNMLYMLSKPHAQQTYDLVYSFNILDWMSTSNVHYAINWHSYGYFNMKLYNIEIDAPNADNSGEVYTHATLNVGAGGSATITGATATGNDYSVIKGKPYTLTVTSASGMKLLSVTVNGQSVAFTEENGIYKAIVTISSTGTINVLFDDKLFETTVKFGSSLRDMAGVKAVCGDKVRYYTVTMLVEDLSDGVAYKNNTDRILTIRLPKGTWTLTFYSDPACTKQLGTSTITATVE